MLDLKEIMDVLTMHDQRGTPADRIKMRRKDWDKLLDDVRSDGSKPLYSPESANPVVGPGDLQSCVGLICGVPVLVDDTLDQGTKFVTEYDDKGRDA